MIEQGCYSAGERLPSIRELSRQLDAGINTVSHAYAWLKNARIVQARPQSGYYVLGRPGRSSLSSNARRDPGKPSPTAVTIDDVKLRIMRSLAEERLIPLSRGAPAADLLPSAALDEMLVAQARSHSLECVSYAERSGLTSLRAQIAQRSLDCGCSWTPREIVITGGCVEAVTLALQATCQKGDVVAVESPVYYTFLNASVAQKTVDLLNGAQAGAFVPRQAALATTGQCQKCHTPNSPKASVGAQASCSGCHTLPCSHTVKQP